jgi:HTH-type transcriptional regulator, sugar sensing transcriptional regulator
VDLTNQLMQIGFTEYEAKVYLALLRLHPATGYQLSKESGVPRSMVYETLSRLHQRGAVLESVEDRSTLYRPLAPQQLLDGYQSDHERLVKMLRLGLAELFEAPGDDLVWTLRGRSGTLTYAAQLISRAERELYLVLTDLDLEALRGDLLAACERDVEVGILLTGEAHFDCGKVARHPPLESEIQDLDDTLLVVADHREALIASASSQPDTGATITGNRDLVLIARQFVWMELLAQRIYAGIGPDLLERLEPEDRRILESLAYGR